MLNGFIMNLSIIFSLELRFSLLTINLLQYKNSTISWASLSYSLITLKTLADFAKSAEICLFVSSRISSLTLIKCWIPARKCWANFFLLGILRELSIDLWFPGNKLCSCICFRQKANFGCWHSQKYIDAEMQFSMTHLVAIILAYYTINYIHQV